MKVREVIPNNHKHEFEIHTRSKRSPVLTFPYCKIPDDVRPTTDNPVVEAYPDPELGNDGFTWVLASGDEGTLHMDSVLWENRDPEYLARMALHTLTCDAESALAKSGLSKAQVAKRLRTSPAQLARLLDPTYYGKSLGQMLALLHVVGQRVKLQVVDESQGE